MKEVSIGLLLPSSSIFPIGKQFEKGLKSALSEVEGVNFEFIPEFIGQGELKQLENTIEKLKSYHDVDMIAGWLSNKGLMEISEKVKGKIPYFINNLGEHTPNPLRIPENVRLNSINLWQQLWSMGHWAVKSLGKKGMIVGGLYDMGYSFSMMLDLGMLAASEDSKWSFAVCPMPEASKLSDPNIVLDHVEREMPDFLFAAFCGEESTLFLNEFIRRGLHTKIPLVGTPYLLENFSEELKESLTIYTSLAAQIDLTTNDIDDNWTQPFGAFYQLGKETGICIEEELNGNRQVVEKRGALNLAPESAGTGNRVFIIENVYAGNKEEMKRTVLTEEKTIDISDETLKSVLDKGDANWLNPYLGI